jgi:glucosamine-6-phosphate deaminase
MKIIIEKDYTALSWMTGRLISNYIKDNPNANISFPTGGSVEGTYEYMCDLLKKENISMSGIKAFNMDEYATLSRNNENGYYYFLNKNIYSKTDIDLNNTFAPEADSSNLQAACEEYTGFIEKQGGFDFILLGIGSDGHIAFNMPGKTLQLDTYIEDLTEDTIKANSRFFEKREDVPRQAVTIGVQMIMKSKKIVLLASGKGKADILGQMLNNRTLDTMLPASTLWMHPDVTFILDKDAASEIDMASIESSI